MVPGPRSPTCESSGDPLLEMDKGVGDLPYKSIVFFSLCF